MKHIFSLLLFLSVAISLHAQDNNYKATELLYTDAINIHPTSSLYLGRAYIRSQSGKYTLAIQDLDSSIKMHPTDTALLLRAGLHKDYFNNDKAHYKLALLDYTTLIKMEPNNKDYYYARAWCYKWTDQKMLAIKDLNACLKLDPYYYDAYNELYTNYELAGLAAKGKQEFSKSIKAYSHLIDSMPDNPQAYYLRGQAISDMYRYSVNENKMTAAIPDFKKAIQLDSTKAYYYFELGFVYTELKNVIEARKCFRHALILDSFNTQYYDYLAVSYENAKDLKSALAVYSSGIEKMPENYMLYQSRGYLYQKMGQYTKYREDIKMRDKLSGN